MKNNGLTLTELLITVAVFGILVIALGMSFEGWQGGYRIESQTKELYDDLMNARMRALQRNRVHFVTLSNLQYSVWEDIDPWPDGDGSLTAADEFVPPGSGYSEPIPLLQKDLNPEYSLAWDGNNQVNFSSRGLSNSEQAICIFSEMEPDYDCIVISFTRINMGKIITQASSGGVCNDANCEVK